MQKLDTEIIDYSPSNIIINPNEKLEKIGLILEGEVEISKTGISGNKLTISKFYKGDIFGEVIALSTRFNKNVTVTSTTNTKIMFIYIDSIINLSNFSQNNNVILQNIIFELAFKANLLNQKIDYLSIKSMRGKLATFIYNTYVNVKKSNFTIPYNRDNLAEFLNVSRPSMSRELVRMRDEGIINFNKSYFEILDIDKLIRCIE